MKVTEKEFREEFIKVWDDGAIKDAPFITLGIEVLLKDFYGDLLDAPPPFPVEKGATVLDLGCGWGRILKPVMDRGARGIGLDISGEMLSRSYEHLRRSGHRPPLIRADGSRLPFKSERFDMIYSFLVLQHLSKRDGEAVFREIERVLKPNGVAYIRVPGRFAPENLLFSFLQFISIHILRVKDPIQMRFYRLGELKRICNKLFPEYTITAHEFRPPWNFHTKWTWKYIIIPRCFHRTLRKISDSLERIANNRIGFLKHFGVVLIVTARKGAAPSP